jgi:hypothetical protein
LHPSLRCCGFSGKRSPISNEIDQRFQLRDPASRVYSSWELFVQDINGQGLTLGSGEAFDGNGVRIGLFNKTSAVPAEVNYHSLYPGGVRNFSRPDFLEFVESHQIAAEIAAQRDTPVLNISKTLLGISHYDPALDRVTFYVLVPEYSK